MPAIIIPLAMHPNSLNVNKLQSILSNITANASKNIVNINMPIKSLKIDVIPQKTNNNTSSHCNTNVKSVCDMIAGTNTCKYNNS